TVSVNGGTLTVVDNNNSFGALNVNSGGTLEIGDGVTSGAGTIGSAAVNMSAGSVILNRPDATTSNTAFNGTGTVNKIGSNTLTTAFQHVTLVGDTTIGGSGRFDIRGGGTLGLTQQGFTLTKNGAGGLAIVGSTVTDGNIVVNGGSFSFETSSVMNTGTGSVN